MKLNSAFLIALTAVALAACGRPDPTGLYLSRADRQVTLVQLAQTADGAVIGRIEQLSIGPGGRVSDQSATLDGTAAQHDLTFRPAGAALGGQGAAGKFSRDGLELNGHGLALVARRSNLKDYQAAVARLELAAAAERRRVSDAQAQQAASAAAAAPIKDAPNKAARVDAAAAQLRKDAAALDAGIDSAPDFGRQSAQNTAQVAKLAQAPSRQAAASASQLIVATNQVEFARSQYAAGLNPIAERGAPLATDIQRFCGSADAARLAEPCARATAAATDFQSALVHAVTVFNGYKRAVQLELERQNEMVRKMGG